MPPLKNAPIGTSATSCSLRLSKMARRPASRDTDSFQSAGSRFHVQYVPRSIPRLVTRNHDPGSTSWISEKNVRGGTV